MYKCSAAPLFLPFPFIRPASRSSCYVSLSFPFLTSFMHNLMLFTVRGRSCAEGGILRAHEESVQGDGGGG